MLLHAWHVVVNLSERSSQLVFSVYSASIVNANQQPFFFLKFPPMTLDGLANLWIILRCPQDGPATNQYVGFKKLDVTVTVGGCWPMSVCVCDKNNSIWQRFDPLSVSGVGAAYIDEEGARLVLCEEIPEPHVTVTSIQSFNRGLNRSDHNCMI